METINVILPSHLYIPENAESIDARVLCEIAPNVDAETELLRIKANEGEKFRFINYAIFCDAEDQSTFEFFPRIDGKRILRLHGTPQENGSYKIALGLAPDMRNDALISCNILLKPNQLLTWHVKNIGDITVPMGVRMVGYVDNLNQRKEGLFK